MLTRQEIKQKAKESFYEQRNFSIGLYIIYVLLCAAATGLTLGIGSIFVIPVLTISLNVFFHKVYNREACTISDYFNSLFDNYLHKLGGYWWMILWTFLWTLLFYIPGIVKTVAYSMTPYILDEYPEVSAKDAIKISNKITYGYKMDIFVAFLSFIGWELLSACTFGILEILFVGPYRETTFGGIYEELKMNALHNNVITEDMLHGGAID